MNILALDLATRCGWARIEHGREESGVETFDVKRGESPGIRYVNFSRWLEDLVIREERSFVPVVDLVVYEQTLPFGPGAIAREIETGFATHVQAFCARHGIQHAAPLYPSQLKKWTTGRGNATKPDMLDAVARRWRRVDDHNEADAIALLHWTVEEYVPSGVARA